MASAGTISIDFAAETARFTAELKKVQGSLSRLESDFRSLNKIADVALRALSGAALAAFAKSAFTAADATATAAERAGIAVESFSRLQYAAGQVDVEMSALTSGIQKFQIALSAADSGNKEAQRSLANFNLQAKDLANLAIEEQLSKVAEAFKRITDPADRTRFSVELFGRSAGPQLVPFLAQGEKGIADFTAEADRLGITLKNSTALGIDEADKALKRFIATAKGATADVIGRIALAFSPPKDEAGKLAVQLDALTRERQAILNARAAGNEDAGTGFLGQQTLQEIDAKLVEIQSRLRAIREEAAGGFKMQLAPQLPWLGLQEIDLKPIQAMKIEVNELAEAYRNLDIAAQAVRDKRADDALAEAGAAASAAASASIEANIESLRAELDEKASLAQFYRDEELRREAEAQAIITQLRQATYGNAIAALQAFAGRSEKTAKALVLIEKGKALAQAFMLGKVAIQQAAASAPPPYNIPAIVTATALAAANVAAIAATAYGQIKTISAAGGASLGTSANPVFTSGSDSEDTDQGATSQSVTQVIINGNIFSSRETADWFIEEIISRIDEEDAIIISPNSRQAQDLVQQA